MDIEHYRRVLITQEQELAALLSSTAEAGRHHYSGGLDEGDQSVLSHETDVIFSRVETIKHLIDQVRSARQRIDEGTYGRCEVDGAIIPMARLRAVPWACRCVEHQNLIEDPANEQDNDEES